MKVDSAYISVKNRERAEAYWQQVLCVEPSIKNDTFTFFDINGFLFGLFDASTVSEKINYGNNCVLNLHVKDADTEFTRLEKFAKIVMPLTSVDSYSVFQIEDTEGNVVEFYSD